MYSKLWLPTSSFVSTVYFTSSRTTIARICSGKMHTLHSPSLCIELHSETKFWIWLAEFIPHVWTLTRRKAGKGKWFHTEKVGFLLRRIVIMQREWSEGLGQPWITDAYYSCHIGSCDLAIQDIMVHLKTKHKGNICSLKWFIGL